MKLSISIKKTVDGFMPQLVMDVPKAIRALPAGATCDTWKEAWIIAKSERNDIRKKVSQ